MTERTMYMHTLDGKPARFSELWHIVYRLPVNSRVHQASLVETRAQLNEQRAESRANMRREGLKQGRFGFVLVEVPT